MDGDSNNIQVDPIQQKGLLEQVFSSLAFVVPEDKTVRNGEKIEIPVEFKTTDTSLGLDNHYLFVEVYNCETSSCENQVFVESVKVDTAFQYFNSGETFKTSVTYEVPETMTGEFAVNTYLWNEDKNQVESTISVSQYEVVEPEQDPTGDFTDSDGDGVLDRDDECPNTYGEREDGCPIGGGDQDGDGVADVEDDCPRTEGSGENGCPVDSDSDGVFDLNDECPDESGPIVNKGCPEDSDSGTGSGPSDQPVPTGLIVVGLVLAAGGVYFRYG